MAGQAKDRQHAAQFGEFGQFLVATDRTEAFVVLLEARRQTDTGPAANAGENTKMGLADQMEDRICELLARYRGD